MAAEGCAFCAVIAGGDAWATGDGAWEALLHVNLHGTRRLAEATVPSMLAAFDSGYKLRDHVDQIRMGRELSTIVRDLPITIGLVRTLAQPYPLVPEAHFAIALALSLTLAAPAGAAVSANASAGPVSIDTTGLGYFRAASARTRISSTTAVLASA